MKLYVSLFISIFAAAILAAYPTSAKTFSEMFPQYQDMEPDLIVALEKLDYQQGEITVGRNLATFNISEGYYFLSPKDANTVLVEFWGNPESDAPLGMIFPADITPFHGDGWGLEITFDDIGYVSDDDAADYDYDDLLVQMRKDLVDENIWRGENGYDSIALVGWAETPAYDVTARKLYWAKELSFEGSDGNTLNYNIRALGRKGVLVMNFIAPIEALDEVRASIPDVLAMSSFTDGNRYADFNPSLDKVAAVGIGGLIAGKVIAKTGLLILLLAFLKKGAIIILLPIIWLVNKLRGKGKS
ncbi:MAG: DUF2167 domain-containing protein [Paracoccaceae bacterium]